MMACMMLKGLMQPERVLNDDLSGAVNPSTSLPSRDVMNRKTCVLPIEMVQ